METGAGNLGKCLVNMHFHHLAAAVFVFDKHAATVATLKVGMTDLNAVHFVHAIMDGNHKTGVYHEVNKECEDGEQFFHSLAKIETYPKTGSVFAAAVVN